jgi:hypothetical protein
MHRPASTQKQQATKTTQTHSPALYSRVSAVSPEKVPLAMVLIWLMSNRLRRQTTA